MEEIQFILFLRASAPIGIFQKNDYEKEKRIWFLRASAPIGIFLILFVNDVNESIEFLRASAPIGIFPANGEQKETGTGF